MSIEGWKAFGDSVTECTCSLCGQDFDSWGNNVRFDGKWTHYLCEPCMSDRNQAAEAATGELRQAILNVTDAEWLALRHERRRIRQESFALRWGEHAACRLTAGGDGTTN